MDGARLGSGGLRCVHGFLSIRLAHFMADRTPLCSKRAFASSTLARRDARLWALASEQRGHSHALAPLRRYSFQPAVTASQALPEREPQSNHALGALSPCEMTIACQLKRFALGADVEGVDAHASFPMMAVVVAGRPLQQKPAAQLAGAAGKVTQHAEAYFVGRSPNRSCSILLTVARMMGSP